MNEIEDWNECLRKQIIEVEVDNERIASIVEQVEIRIRRAEETKLSKENVSLILEDYYEAIKDLLIAYLLKNIYIVLLLEMIIEKMMPKYHVIIGAIVSLLIYYFYQIEFLNILIILVFIAIFSISACVRVLASSS